MKKKTLPPALKAALMSKIMSGQGAGGPPPSDVGAPPMGTGAPMPPMPVPGGAPGMKRGGKIKKMASGGVTRADGIAQRGKTKGRFV